MKAVGGLVLFVAFSIGAWAAPIATLVFTTPTGTVGTTDSIPVFVTLSLDLSSPALITDGSGNVISGYMPADITTFLFNNLPPGDTVDVNNDTFTSDITDGYSCSSTFFSGCGGSPYDVNFVGGIAFASNLDFEPGSVNSFQVLEFSPTGGVAPPGTYSFQDFGLFIQIYDQTLGGLHVADVPIADTSNAPAFTRDVVGPEPGTCVLMFAGLALFAGIKRRRS